MSQVKNLGEWQEEMLVLAQQKKSGYHAIDPEEPAIETRLRVRMIWVAILIVFALVGARVLYLQIFDSDQQKLLSEGNHIEQTWIVAKRGRILDRKGLVLADTQDNKRIYPLGKAGSSVLGYLSEVTQSELGCHDGLCYRLGSMIGRSGIEAQSESLLRGRDGNVISEVNAQGEIVRERGRNESEGGGDLKLTIDSRLQVIMYNALDKVRVENKTVKAAAVATNLQGEILGLVSYPTYDPMDITKYLKDTSEQYFFNRAISGEYPPGSVFKMITAYAGLSSGKVTKDLKIEDTGEIKVGEYRYGTWNFDQKGQKEGELDLVGALARSNDIYFYRVGEMVGIEKLIKEASLFGVGEKTGVEITGESSGLLPTPLWKERRTGETWFLGNTYHFAIGQGDILVTPLQVARMSGASVSGRLCSSQLILGNHQECIDLLIPTDDLNTVKAGMKAVCQTGGTAYPFFDFEPYVLCKTGTAQHAGQKTKDDLPHAWITVAYPGENPNLILTILIESGGEGSSVAGPIAKEILTEWKNLGN